MEQEITSSCSLEPATGQNSGIPSLIIKK